MATTTTTTTKRRRQREDEEEEDEDKINWCSKVLQWIQVHWWEIKSVAGKSVQLRIKSTVMCCHSDCISIGWSTFDWTDWTSKLMMMMVMMEGDAGRWWWWWWWKVMEGDAGRWWRNSDKASTCHRFSSYHLPLHRQRQRQPKPFESTATLKQVCGKSRRGF